MLKGIILKIYFLAPNSRCLSTLPIFYDPHGSPGRVVVRTDPTGLHRAVLPCVVGTDL